MSESDARAAPFYCPYCGEEDLRPEEQPHRAWRCADCLRVFVVQLVSLGTPPAAQQTRQEAKP